MSTSTLLVASTSAPSTQTILLVALLGGLAASGLTGVVSARLQKRRLKHETAERQKQLEHDRDERTRQLDHERQERRNERQFAAAVDFAGACGLYVIAVADGQWRIDNALTDSDRAEIIDSLSRAFDKVVELLPPLRIAFGRQSQTSKTAQRALESLHSKRLEQALYVVNRRRARFDDAVRLDLGEE